MNTNDTYMWVPPVQTNYIYSYTTTSIYNDSSSTKISLSVGFEILFVSVLILIWLCSISIALGIVDWIKRYLENRKFKKAGI